MLNLRRFYRTSLIEVYVANMLATAFRRQDMRDFLKRCQEFDTCGSGFFTASDLKNVLVALGHGLVADMVGPAHGKASAWVWWRGVGCCVLWCWCCSLNQSSSQSQEDESHETDFLPIL